jgi:hypothetical protein
VKGVGIVNACEVLRAFPGPGGLARFAAWLDYDLAAERADAPSPPGGGDGGGGGGGRPQLLIENGRPTALFSAVAPWGSGEGVDCAYNQSYTYVQALATT